MNSIESLKLDFNSQISQLANIHNKKICDDCIYVGSGDSLFGFGPLQKKDYERIRKKIRVLRKNSESRCSLSSLIRLDLELSI